VCLCIGVAPPTTHWGALRRLPRIDGRCAAYHALGGVAPPTTLDGGMEGGGSPGRRVRWREGGRCAAYYACASLFRAPIPDPKLSFKRFLNS